MSAVHPHALPRELMVLRIYRELRDGMVVNLGLGIPTLLADVIPNDVDILLHAENGVLGYGPYARPGTRSDRGSGSLQRPTASTRAATISSGRSACT